MESLDNLVERVRAGDVEAYGELVRATQTMAFAVAVGVLRDTGIAQDAVQQAYLQAFRRLGTLLRGVYPEFVDQPLPEVLDFDSAQKTMANDAVYVEPHELHRLGDGRILRYDLTLPLLLTVRYT